MVGEVAEFQLEQVVRIVRQSRTVNSQIDMVGLIGFIEEFREYEGEKLAQFYGLSSGGMGTVPLSCLAPVDPDADAQWIQAKADHDAKCVRLMREAGERDRRRKRVVALTLESVARDAGLSERKVQEVVSLYEKTLYEMGERRDV